MTRKHLVLLFLACALPLSLARAEDLVTRDGTVYHDYKVLGHDAGYLTIMYSEGGGKIPLSNLPDDLQKQYGYNKQQADAAVQAATEQDRQDRQALAKEEAAHQQQQAAQAQVTRQVEAVRQAEAAPAVSGPSPPSLPAAPAPDPSGIPSSSLSLIPAPNANRVSGPSAPAIVPAPVAATPPAVVEDSKEQIEALKKKISALEDVVIGLQMGEVGVVVDSPSYVKAMSENNENLAVMRGQLAQMETNQPRSMLRWTDVQKLHDQIVDLEDDADRCAPDSAASSVREKVTADYEILDDHEAIAVLRQTVQMSPKQPIRLSPEQVSDMKREIADLRDETDKLAATMSDGGGFSAQHECNSDSEQSAFLQEKLIASGNP